MFLCSSLSDPCTCSFLLFPWQVHTTAEVQEKYMNDDECVQWRSRMRWGWRWIGAFYRALRILSNRPIELVWHFSLTTVDVAWSLVQAPDVQYVISISWMKMILAWGLILPDVQYVIGISCNGNGTLGERNHDVPIDWESQLPDIHYVWLFLCELSSIGFFDIVFNQHCTMKVL
jgi:hypothetical protein